MCLRCINALTCATLEHGFMFIACFLQEERPDLTNSFFKTPFADLGSKVALVIFASNYLVNYKNKQTQKINLKFRN